MKNAIKGYLKILKEDGLHRAFWSFYSYYYSKYKLKKLRKRKNFKVKTHGCELIVNPNDEGLSLELLVFGDHERDTTKFVSDYLEKGIICVDIGANIGYYSTLYSKLVGQKGKLISIEPSPINFKYLEKNLQLQKNKNYTLFNCACGNKDGIVKFLLDERANKCRVIQDKDEISYKNSVIEIPVRKLDDIVEETNLKNIDFLKIDVEGYEWNVLQGAIKSLKKFVPTIQIEIHLSILGSTKTKQVLQFLKDLNYSVIYHDIGGDEGVFLRRKTPQNFSIDDFLSLSIIKKHQNSFKLILKNNYQ